MTIRTMGMGAAAWLLTIGIAAAAPAPDSRRMGHAKDLIADEQWSRAIVELQAAAKDPKEANRDEALFWLAHSQHQVGDDASALQTIATLERTAPSSPWRKPAGSLRVEIAQRLRRDDVLLMMVTPPAPPLPPPLPRSTPTTPRPFVVLPTPSAVAPVAATPAVPPPPGPPPAAPPAAPARGANHPVRAATPAPAPPVAAWSSMPASEFWMPPAVSTFDISWRVQALSSLVDTHADQAIPMLRQIALDPNSPDEARQAVFVLGQSRRPDAQRTVVEVAHQGAEPVRIAAVRELGRFDGATISGELLRVYDMANAPPRLKRQIVASLGDRADKASLVRIVTLEQEPTVRDFAIVTLGRTGGGPQLRALYGRAPRVSRPAVLDGLFAARDDDELIRIAKTETDPALRARSRLQLRMLSTPKAVKFLEDNP